MSKLARKNTMWINRCTTIQRSIGPASFILVLVFGSFAFPQGLHVLIPVGLDAHPEHQVRPTDSRPLPPTQTHTTPARKTKPSKPFSLYPRIVAEFEPQRAILFSVSDLQPHHSHVLKQIARKSAGHANILILYNDNFQLKKTVQLLNDVEHSHISFYKLELDTVWLRDFGPRITQETGGTRALDFYYYGVRPLDDSFPERWALKTQGRLDKIPWTLQGGNLICNGQGIGLTTRKLLEDNQVSLGPRTSSAEGQQFVLEEVRSLCNLRDLVVLEPLRNESTKHVDMFATFLGADHVLVAEVDPRLDRENARVLDWNARKLAALAVNGKKMLVSRIQIPQRDGNAWSTYTNAIITDRLVLLPTMNSDGRTLVANAVATYRRLLPKHHIATIDISSMKDLQGSLHCMSLNLPAIAKLPKGVISYVQATQIANRTAPPQNDKRQAQPQLFPMHKQLRRVFKSASSDYLLDAYAVNLIGDVLTLLRVHDRKTIQVRSTGVCKTDQYWLQRNADKIRMHGTQVLQQVIAGDIDRTN